MDNILIMGGSKFVGLSLAKYLIEKNYNVDILTNGVTPINYSGFKHHLICNRKIKDELQNTLKEKEYNFVFDISAYTKEDVEILINSLNKSTLKKYIFCSSGAIYNTSSDMISESFEKGNNPYWGKYGMDKKAAEDFIINSNIPFLIFRPTYIYGEENNLYREVYFFHRLKENKPIPMPFGNNTKTQFIHIKDLVKVLESAIHNNCICECYNVTYPEIISWEKLIITCGEVSGITPIIKSINSHKINIDSRSYFPFRDVTYMLDTKKLKFHDFYFPTINLKDGLRLSYSWFLKEHPTLSDKRMSKVEEVINML